MNNRILFISFSTIYNCTGVHELAQYSADVIGAMEMFKRLGFDLYIHNPYKTRHRRSQVIAKYGEDKVLETPEVLERLSEFKFCVTRFNSVHCNRVSGRINFGPELFMGDLLRKVIEVDIKVYNICADYRPNVLPAHTESDKDLTPRLSERADFTTLNSICEAIYLGNFRMLLASTELPEGFEGIKNVTLSNFMDYNILGMQRDPQLSPTSNWKYDYLYGGVGAVKNGRRKRLLALTSHIENKALVGKVKLPGWTNITNGKATKTAADYAAIMGTAKLNIVFAEPWHDFITPRFYESLTSGSIFACDYTYSKGVEYCRKYGLEDRIVETSDDIDAILSRTDVDAVYEQQIKAYNLIKKDLPQPFFADVL